MIIFAAIRDLLARLVDGLPDGVVTGLLLLLAALFGYLALFAPLGQRRRFLLGAL